MAVIPAQSPIRLEITGLNALKFILSRAHREAQLSLAQALYEESLVVFNKTQRQTPVRFGVLRSTGYVTPPTITNDFIEVTIGYGGPAAPYAIYVHERVYAPSGRRVRHDAPTKAKFLEDPVLEAAPTFGNRVQRRLAGQIFRGG